MSKSKLTLIIDGNWLLMSRLSAIYSRYANDDEMIKELKMLMIKSINLVLRTFTSIDNIVFVADGGSWRNKIEKPAFLDAEYKGNREQDESMPWDLIFSGYEEFIDTLKNSGITVCKEAGIEGDDWCWWLSKHFNSQNTNVMIWSRDKDLTQLVNVDSDGCFTICWNKDSGVTKMEKAEEEMDFFFNMDFSENDQIMQNIIEKSSEVHNINPKNVVIDKIIRGDAGDNIFPILVRKSKTNSDKKFKVSQKDIDMNLDIFAEDKIRNYIDSLLTSKSYAGRVDKTAEQIYEHFLYNRELVYLDKSSYPEEVLKKIESSYIGDEPNKDLSEAEEKITAERFSINSIMDLL